MKTVVAVVLACLAPSLGFAASLTGSSVASSAAVNLPAVGTLDWARWPGYTRLGSAISNITTTGLVKTYDNDPRIVGTRRGVKDGGVGASFQFTVAATTTERTLTYYIGGWNSTGRVTVTLAGAPTYTTTFSSTSTFSRVITVRFRADAPTTLRVNYTMTAGSGSINMQAAALSQTAPNGAATLTWQPPTLNTDGSPLSDLAAYKVYWSTTRGTYPQTQSTRLSSASRSHTVSGLPRGTWYFVVTALNAQGLESPYSNTWSKTIQ
jgi:hypothetical protein